MDRNLTDLRKIETMIGLYEYVTSNGCDIIIKDNKMFHKIVYKDEETSDIQYDTLKGSYVKLIVETKEDRVLFDKTLKSINDADVADLKII